MMSIDVNLMCSFKILKPNISKKGSNDRSVSPEKKITSKTSWRVRKFYSLII